MNIVYCYDNIVLFFLFQNVNKIMADLPRTSVYFWLTVLALCQCLAGKPTTATTAHHRWSLAELSVTSSELPKQIPAPPYPVLQQRVQSTPHYDQQLKLPSGNGVGVGPRRRRHHYPWTQPTSSMSWTETFPTTIKTYVRGYKNDLIEYFTYLPPQF